MIRLSTPIASASPSSADVKVWDETAKKGKLSVTVTLPDAGPQGGDGGGAY
jgi:hypothetical protein